MRKKFNTAGPCVEDRHYMQPAAARVAHVRTLIDDAYYFVIHAPRQVGKTTSMLALAKELTEEGTYAAVVLSCEQGAPYRDSPDQAERAMLSSWLAFAQAHLPVELQPPTVYAHGDTGDALRAFLGAWAAHCPRPLALFIDEIDALENMALITLLRQLRAGYTLRPRAFPHSIALFGMRDVRDYKVASGGSDRLNTSSPFNVKAESLTLRNFNHDEVFSLLNQHTAATGQVFEPEALEHIWYLTQGQPWLVNALARHLVEVLVPDRSQSIAPERVEEAKENLIKRRDTHLDSLGERLREKRVQRVLSSMLSGEILPDMPEDDLRYVLDLGLLEERSGVRLRVANPIYAEIIPRVLTRLLEGSIEVGHPAWLNPLTGQLDLARLQAAFLTFWREHGTALLGSSPYAEAAPQLVLMAFLHRVANGGGRVQREYAIGSGRLDLLLEFKGVKLAIECKVKRAGQTTPLKAGLIQLDRYLEGLSWPEGWEGSETFQAWLFVPEQRDPKAPGKPPKVRTEWRLTHGKRKVLVILG